MLGKKKNLLFVPLSCLLLSSLFVEDKQSTIKPLTMSSFLIDSSSSAAYLPCVEQKFNSNDAYLQSGYLTDFYTTNDQPSAETVITGNGHFGYDYYQHTTNNLSAAAAYVHTANHHHHVHHHTANSLTSSAYHHALTDHTHHPHSHHPHTHHGLVAPHQQHQTHHSHLTSSSSSSPHLPTPPNSEPGSPSNQIQLSHPNNGTILVNHTHLTATGQPASVLAQPSQATTSVSPPTPPTTVSVAYNPNNGHHLTNGTTLHTSLSMHSHAHLNPANHHHHHHNHHHHSHHLMVTDNNSNSMASQENIMQTIKPESRPINGSALTLSQTNTAPIILGTQKYNRRNNPELEKRRIHHCDFQGKQN